MSLLTVHDFVSVIRPLFVETGTNTGNTLANAAEVFERCISIEQNTVLHAQCVQRFWKQRNVHLYLGDSPHMLELLITSNLIKPEVPTTFWLDAHYFVNGDTLGPSGQCPILKEIAAIKTCDWETKPIILIDDAFMFDRELNHPGFTRPFWSSNDSGYDNYDKKQWPEVSEIDAALAGYKRTMHSEFILKYEAL